MLKFHMLIEIKMIKRLTLAGSTRGFKLSKTIRLLLDMVLPVFERSLIEGFNEQDASDNDYHEKHIRIDKEVYRRLKKLHADCDTFSMALIVRGMLFEALRVVDEMGWDAAAGSFARVGEDLGKKKLVFFRSKQKKTHMDTNNTIKTVYTKNYIPIYTQYP